jgi:hypothetical protein
MPSILGVVIHLKVQNDLLQLLIFYVCLFREWKVELSLQMVILKELDH